MAAVSPSRLVSGASPAPDAAVHIELMQECDVARAREIESASFEHPWTPGAFASELQNPTSSFWVARMGANGRVVGLLGLWRIAEEVHITNLAVDPEWRRRGIGGLLMLHALAASRAEGALRATLEMRRSNFSARRLYERAGFVVTGIRPRYYLDNDEDAVILWVHDLWSPEFCFRQRQLRQSILRHPAPVKE